MKVINAMLDSIRGRAAAQVARRAFWSLLSLMGLSVLVGCATATSPPPRVVTQVDVDRYLGTWYEIARLPFSIQEGCVATTATYSKREDGDLRVENRCLDGSFDGEPRVAVGKAWLADPSSTAKLKVQFFWPFRGDYWVIDLDDDYQWALVGTPDREYLWILSRDPALEEDQYDALVARAQQEGYPVGELLQTPQPVAEASQPSRAATTEGT